MKKRRAFLHAVPVGRPNSGVALVCLQRKEQAGSVFPGHFLPGNARECAFERPEQIEAGLGFHPLDLGKRRHRPQRGQFLDAVDARGGQEGGGLWAQVGQRGERHGGAGSWRWREFGGSGSRRHDQPELDSYSA